MNHFGVLVAGIVCSFLGLVLYAVGVATPVWLRIEPLGNFGLWQFCITVLDVTTCGPYSDFRQLSVAIHATRAFAVIGPLLLIAGIVLACITATTDSCKDRKIGGALIISAGICGAMAAAIFTGQYVTNTKGLPPPFGYSLYLTWGQTVFTVGGGAAIIAAGRREERQDEIPVLW